MGHISFDYSKALSFFSQEEIDNLQSTVTALDKDLREGLGAGNDFTGWINLPRDYDKEEFARIKAAAKKIQEESEVLVVIGIGGSYLGARAAIDFLNHAFYNYLPSDKRKTPQVLFAGNSISSTYLQGLIDLIGDRDFSVNVISKSGTTTEPAIAFRVFKDLLIKKYGKEEAVNRIYATTDRARGALKSEADVEGYQTFVIPDDVGGRFTVLTELLINYEPTLQYFSEWWKQLFGESEGKDFKGIYPSSANFSTDLHSLGQYIQEGRRNIFETVIKVGKPNEEVTIPETEEDLDGLGYLQGKTMDFVNTKAFQGTLLAHTDGQVPNFVVNIPDMSAYTLGHLIYFFEIAVGLSGYLNGVNPFDQPGVEAYKKNMFALLGKPGFEDLAKELNERL